MSELLGDAGSTPEAVEPTDPIENGSPKVEAPKTESHKAHSRQSNKVLITVRQVLLGTAAAAGLRPAKKRQRVRRPVVNGCDYFEHSRMAREMDRL
jgi:hypothetical protein